MIEARGGDSGALLKALFSEVKTLRVGSEALLLYPEGDVDTVTIVEFVGDPLLLGSHVRVRLPDGLVRRVLPEDIGIGVDDDIRVAL